MAVSTPAAWACRRCATWAELRAFAASDCVLIAACALYAAGARRTAKFVATGSPLIADLVKQGKVKVVAARYDLDDGKVEFFA